MAEQFPQLYGENGWTAVYRADAQCIARYSGPTMAAHAAGRVVDSIFAFARGILRDTYVINSIEDLGPHMSVITVAQLGSDTFVDCRCGDRVVSIPLGVPLCSGCDEPVTGRRCSCETVN